MRNLFFSICFGLFAFAGNAQNSNPELELYQSIFNSEKRVMVTEYMNLSEAQSVSFFSVYDAYEADRVELGKQRITLLQKYADNYEKMTDESAAELLKDANSFYGKLEKNKAKYSKKMSKAVSAKKALQWLQFEEYLDRVIGLSIMENVPFVGEYN
jgi:hypothetical protein